MMLTPTKRIWDELEVYQSLGEYREELTGLDFFQPFALRLSHKFVVRYLKVSLFLK